MKQTHQSWEKQLNSKQFRIQLRGKNVATLVTKRIYNRQARQHEEVPFNADDRKWR